MVVAYLDGLLSMFMQDHVTNKKHYISTKTIPLVTKLSRVVWFSCDFVWSRDQFNTYKLHLHQNKRHEHGKLVTYHWELAPINSHKLLNLRSCKVTRQTKNITSPLSIYHGPYYTSTVCHLCLYKKSVRLFRDQKYDISASELHCSITTFNGKI